MNGVPTAESEVPPTSSVDAENILGYQTLTLHVNPYWNPI